MAADGLDSCNLEQDLGIRGLRQQDLPATIGVSQQVHGATRLLLNIVPLCPSPSSVTLKRKQSAELLLFFTIHQVGAADFVWHAPGIVKRIADSMVIGLPVSTQVHRVLVRMDRLGFERASEQWVGLTSVSPRVPRIDLIPEPPLASASLPRVG